MKKTFFSLKKRSMGLLNPGWSQMDREHCWPFWIQNTLFVVTCANLEKKILKLKRHILRLKSNTVGGGAKPQVVPNGPRAFTFFSKRTSRLFGHFGSRHKCKYYGHNSIFQKLMKDQPVVCVCYSEISPNYNFLPKVFISATTISCKLFFRSIT